jgi:hypothetical protein
MSRPATKAQLAHRKLIHAEAIAVADGDVLRCQVEGLRTALEKVLSAREAEAKAYLSYQVALQNFGPQGRAREATNHMHAMTAASAAEREARLLLATLRQVSP